MKKPLVLIIVLIAVTSVSLAQQNVGTQRRQGAQGAGQGQRQAARPGNTPASLLANPRVQAELQLSSEQKDQLAAVLPQRGQAGQRNQTNQGSNGANSQQASELAKKISEILDDKQEARLAELVIQRSGNRAVFDEKVAAKLDLSSEQKDKLATFRDRQRASRQQAGGQGSASADRQAAREARLKAEQALDSEIAQILSDKQKDMLKSLGGKPFKFED